MFSKKMASDLLRQRFAGGGGDFFLIPQKCVDYCERPSRGARSAVAKGSPTSVEKRKAHYLDPTPESRSARPTDFQTGRGRAWAW